MSIEIELSEQDHADLLALLRAARGKHFDGTRPRWREVSRRLELGLKTQQQAEPYEGIAAKCPPEVAGEWKFAMMVYGDYPALSETGRGILSGCLIEDLEKILMRFEPEGLVPAKVALRVERAEEVSW